MRVLTFNLHSTYLHLLSFTNWDIENLVIPPPKHRPFHSQPYGYPTHSAACHEVPGYVYGKYFPKDWRQPPPVPIAPPVTNITDVDTPTGDYDLVIYLERNSIRFYEGPARKKAMVNLSADGFVHPNPEIITVSHVPGRPQVYIPMGIPDDFLPRSEHPKRAVLTNFSNAKYRTHMLDAGLIKVVNSIVPVHIHDIEIEEWSYDRLHRELADYLLYLSAAVVPGGPVLATQEALMAGMPCILYDVHGHFSSFTDSEVIRIQGQNDVPRVLPISEERAAEIGAAGRAKAQTVFNINHFVEGWQKLAGVIDWQPVIQKPALPEQLGKGNNVSDVPAPKRDGQLKVAILCRSLGAHCGIAEYAVALGEWLGAPVVATAEDVPEGTDVVFVQYEFPSLYKGDMLLVEREIRSLKAVPVIDAHANHNLSRLAPIVKSLGGFIGTKVPHDEFESLPHIGYPKIEGEDSAPSELMLGAFGFALPNKRYEEIIELCDRLQVLGLILACVATATPLITKISQDCLESLKVRAAKCGLVRVDETFLTREQVVKKLRLCSHLVSAKRDFDHTSGSLRLMALAGRPIISVPCLGAEAVGVIQVDSLDEVTLEFLSRDLPLPVAGEDGLDAYKKILQTVSATS